jgi:hypothetical protein
MMRMRRSLCLVLVLAACQERFERSGLKEPSHPNDGVDNSVVTEVGAAVEMPDLEDAMLEMEEEPAVAHEVSTLVQVGEMLHVNRLAHFSLDGGAGDTAAADGGSASATLAPGSWVLGRSAGSFAVRGTLTLDVQLPAHYSLGAWVLWPPGADAALFSGAADSDGCRPSQLQSDGVSLRTYDCTTYGSVAGLSPTPGWHHIMVSWDGEALRYYQDGMDAGFAPGPFSMARLGQVGPFGDVDSFSIYDNAFGGQLQVCDEIGGIWHQGTCVHGRKRNAEVCAATLECLDGSVCITVAGESLCRQGCGIGTCADSEVCVFYADDRGYCAPKAREGEDCSSASGQVCEPGFRCIAQEGAERCRQDCTVGSCPKTRVCQALLGSNNMYCAPGADLGETCSPTPCLVGLLCVEEICQSLCEADGGCTGNYVCKQTLQGHGYCFARGGAVEGDVCASTDECVKGRRCVGEVCATQCGESADCNRDAFQACEDGLCTPVGPNNSTVQFDGQTFDRCLPESPNCRSGHVCVSYDDAQRGYCAEIVADGALCGGVLRTECGLGSTCLTRVGEDRCYRNCDALACGPGYACSASTAGNHCFEASAEGEPCDENRGCVAGHRCIAEFGNSLCRAECTTACAAGFRCLPFGETAYCAPTTGIGGDCLGDAGLRCEVGAVCVGPDGSSRCEAACASEPDCAADQTCVRFATGSGYCAAAVGALEACAGHLCHAGFGCVDLAGRALCRPLCDAAGQGCMPDETCEPYGPDGWYCREVALEGEACGGAADMYCQKGFVCRAEGESSACRKLCHPSAPDCGAARVCRTTDPKIDLGYCGVAALLGESCAALPCQENLTCLRQGSNLRCAQSCAGSDECPVGLACEALQSGEQFCFARGASEENDACQINTDCAFGHNCLRVGERTACALQCSGAEGCRDGQSCVAAAGGNYCWPLEPDIAADDPAIAPEAQGGGQVSRGCVQLQGAWLWALAMVYWRRRARR